LILVVAARRRSPQTFASVGNGMLSSSSIPACLDLRLVLELDREGLAALIIMALLVSLALVYHPGGISRGNAHEKCNPKTILKTRMIERRRWARQPAFPAGEGPLSLIQVPGHTRRAPAQGGWDGARTERNTNHQGELLVTW